MALFAVSWFAKKMIGLWNTVHNLLIVLFKIIIQGKILVYTHVVRALLQLVEGRE